MPRMLITPIPSPDGDGFILADPDGKPVQEGFTYPSKWEALQACRQLWPSNSVWHGRPSGSSWSIEADE